MSIAVDFGNLQTKVATFNSMTGRPEKRLVIPSLVYAPFVGTRLVAGSEAVEGFDQDPDGMVQDLKSLIGKSAVFKNNKSWSTIDIVAAVFKEIRFQLLSQNLPEKDIKECHLTVPVQYTDHERESLRQAAIRGGFQPTEPIDEPISIARHCDRDDPIGSDDLVVCDIGESIRLTLLRRTESTWVVATEPLHKPVKLWDGLASHKYRNAEEQPDGVLKQVLDVVIREMAVFWQQLKSTAIKSPTFLFVGGGSVSRLIRTHFVQFNEQMLVRFPQESALSACFGAVTSTPKTNPRSHSFSWTPYDGNAPA